MICNGAVFEWNTIVSQWALMVTCDICIQALYFPCGWRASNCILQPEACRKHQLTCRSHLPTKLSLFPMSGIWQCSTFNFKAGPRSHHNLWVGTQRPNCPLFFRIFFHYFRSTSTFNFSWMITSKKIIAVLHCSFFPSRLKRRLTDLFLQVGDLGSTGFQ